MRYGGGVCRPGSRRGRLVTEELPEEALAPYVGWRRTVVWRNEAGTLTVRLESPAGERHFLKVASADVRPSLEEEARRLRWVGPRLPVPRVIAQGRDGDRTWLATVGLPGRDATDPVWSSDPDRLVRALADGLLRFHAAPMKDCPFDFRLESALAHVRGRVSRREVDADRDFHAEFAHLSVDQAVEVLERERPDAEDPVLCHGDYCLPNVLLEDWRVCGFVDLGELGVADRWWDVAVASWSVVWNVGAEYEQTFLDAYGVRRDDPRMRYYRLLYDMAS